MFDFCSCVKYPCLKEIITLQGKQMTISKLMDCENKRINKFLKFRLANYFKIIGAVLCLISILMILMHTELDLSKIFGQKLMLISLLLITLSKEKTEDEFIVQLRSQSFSVAFIFGIAYSIYQPVVSYFVENLLENEPVKYSDLGDFQVLVFMLLIYLGIFSLMKRVS